MKKRALYLAIAAATAPGFANAGAEVSGFADIIYTLTNDNANAAANCDAATDANRCKNTAEGKFSADAEVDFTFSPADGVTVRVDVDLRLANPAGSSNPDGSVINNGDEVDTTGADIEQAFFAWGVGPGTLIGGVFNNPIGAEAEDAPDLDFTTHSVVYDILDGQTALDGNNLAGLAYAVPIGPVTITGAVVNDLNQGSSNPGGHEEASFALVVNASPVAGLDLEFGYVTQDDSVAAGSPPNTPAPTAGDVIDLNGTYSISGFTVGLDYLVASNIVDSAYTLWGGYEFGGSGFGVKIRTENVSFETPPGATGSAEADVLTLYGSYQAASNLLIALEYRNDESSPAVAVPGAITDWDTITAEFIATF